MVRKLWGKKTYSGYTHQDYKEWGEQGGRPRKFKNEAEKKRFYRQQKASAEGRTLRGYKTYSQTVLTSTRELGGGGKIAIDFINCPLCKISMAEKEALIIKYNEYGQQIEYCGKCGYEPTKKIITRRAGTDAERKRRQREEDKNEEEEDED